MTIEDLFQRIDDVKAQFKPVDPQRLTSLEIEELDDAIARELADRFDEVKAEEEAEKRTDLRLADRRNPDAHLGAEEREPGYGHGV